MVTRQDKNDGSDGGELNYSLGILIILLMIFWFMCKSMGNCGNGTYNTSRYSNNRYPLMRNLYGGRRWNNNRIPVPSSKTSERKLYDENGDDSEDHADEKQVNMGPKSKTESHKLMCGNEHKRTS
jgi:hypothetical protein